MAVVDNTVKWKVKKVALGTITEMVGATESQRGKSGIVPAPAAGDVNKILHSDGTWRSNIQVQSIKTASGIEIY